MKRLTTLCPACLFCMLPICAMIFLRILLFILGIAIVARALISALRTIVLPRGERDQIAAFVFLSLRRLYNIGLRFTTTYEQRDLVMSSYGPVGLLLLLPVWLILVASGYVLMYLATGIESINDSIVISGSSLLTLGLFKGNSLVHSILELSLIHI